MNVLSFIEDPPLDAPAPAYLFCPGKEGPKARETTFEPFLADRAIECFTAAVDPSLRDFALATFYADETPAEAVVLEAQTLPFLADRRVIVARNVERYETESASAALIAYLESPNPSTVLLLAANRVDKRTKLYKACEKHGEVIECPMLGQAQVEAWVRDEAKARGKTIGLGASKELVRRVGRHLSDVNNALTLVINFLGENGKTITEETVAAVCGDVAEEEIWALTDAIAESKPGEALLRLKRLTDLGKHADEIMGTINWLVKSAYLVATMKQPPMSEFQRRKFKPLADKWGAKKSRDAFALCTDTHFLMRSTGTDARLAMELLVVKLAAPRPTGGGGAENATS